MSPTSYQAAPPRGDVGVLVPASHESVNNFADALLLKLREQVGHGAEALAARTLRLALLPGLHVRALLRPLGGRDAEAHLAGRVDVQDGDLQLLAHLVVLL